MTQAEPIAEPYQAAVAAIEVREGWTVEDAESCGCNSHPEGPCDRCWSLGWAIGGIKIQEARPHG